MKNLKEILTMAILMAAVPFYASLANHFQPDTSSNLPEDKTFVTVNNAYEVSNIDKATTDMAMLKQKKEELNSLLEGVGSVHLGKKGLIVSFDQAEVLGLDNSKAKEGSAEYKKLVKALDTFENGTVIVAGQTNASPKNESMAQERAVEIAETLSHKNVMKDRILVDPRGVSFISDERRKPASKNTVEFLLVPPTVK